LFFDLHSFPTRRSSDLIYINFYGMRSSTRSVRYSDSPLKKDENAVRTSYCFVLQQIGDGSVTGDRTGCCCKSFRRPCEQFSNIPDRKSTRLNSSHVSIS